MNECVKPDDDGSEEEKTENRRMWCLQQAMSGALSVFHHAPQAPLIPIVQTAEEMCEFIETGVARTHSAPKTPQ